MKHYVMTDDNENVISIHSINEKKGRKLPAGAVAITSSEATKIQATMLEEQWRIVRGKPVSVARKKDVNVVRRGEYPDVGEQLGALWKAVESLAARVEGETPPEVGEILEQIKSVKHRFPKEE